jgi:hypothetical protein
MGCQGHLFNGLRDQADNLLDLSHRSDDEDKRGRPSANAAGPSAIRCSKSVIAEDSAKGAGPWHGEPVHWCLAHTGTTAPQAEYRRKIFDSDALAWLQEHARRVVAKTNCKLLACDGEADQLQLLVEYPPKLRYPCS